LDYRDTLNLPKTEFPMKAGLPVKEPEILNFWKQENVYNTVLEKRKGNKKFILHDGPPYSNGPINLGQALNKVLKDIIVKYKSLTGYYAPFIPGWDTHGLPNEIAAIKTFKLNRKEIDPLELRQKCRESALHFMRIQRDQFRRLGVYGDWDNPYLTLNHSYETTVIETFRKMVREGLIYKGLKPVYWCPHCETALADAEIEYRNKKSPSIFVKFELKNSIEIFPKFQYPVFVLIWTTTPWTLPGNMAIALHSNERYCLVKVNDEGLIMAESLVDYVMEQCGIEDYEFISSFPGKMLECKKTYHPFMDHISLLIMEDYVTMEQGTGCVHTAPGHGQEDYDAALEYNLPITVPVNDYGILTTEAGPFKGLRFNEANNEIIKYLNKSGHLLCADEVEHSYPHCWRCRNPVIFRATEQWFVAVDVNNLRKRAIARIEDVNWIPSWGMDRIANMLKERPDWCISRQRVWGVPLPVFRCLTCNKPVVEMESIEYVKKLISEHGSDIWFKLDSEELLPDGFTCPHCGSEDIEKEIEIFDVWFESGVSHEAVCNKRPELSWPADMYLESSDQHRGWFQLSLLPSVAVKDRAPYKQVLTHGWILDEKGVTMHKSLGNAIDPINIVNEYGADILRLFISSVDYTRDIRIGKTVLDQTAEVYKKIRNTIRFMLGNLYDFNPGTDAVEDRYLESLDRFILHKKNKLMEKVHQAYDKFQFHQVYYHIHNFCVLDLSQFYLDIQKDILYVESPVSQARRSAQTAIYNTLRDLTIALAPIISFTAEEIWRNYKPFMKQFPSVMMNDFQLSDKKYLSKEEETMWEIFMKLREQIYVSIEKLREEGKVRDSSQCRVDIHAGGNVLSAINRDRELLKSILKVAQLNVFDESIDVPDNAVKSEIFPRTAFIVSNSGGKRCPRCRSYYQELEESGICKRCEHILSLIS